MEIYLALMVIVLFAGVIDHSTFLSNYRFERKRFLVKFLFISIFLVCALRSPTVGRDIPGYERAYELTKDVPFWDFNYIYFESGYLLLMKICVSLHMNFQGFLAVVYLIILYPLYYLIKRYSYSPIFSILIYVCYMLFEFDLTALRQAIAMSIILFSFVVLMEKSKCYILKFILIVILAATFHKSALLCLVLLPLVSINDLRKYAILLVGLGLFGLAARNYLLQYIKVLFSKDTMNAGATMYIGGNIIFLFIITLFMLCIHFHELWKEGVFAEYIDSTIIVQNTIDFQLNKIFMFSIVVALFFGNDTSARSFMYFMQVIVVLLPNIIYKLETKSRMLVSIVFIVFFCIFFYWNSLSGGGFDITPYKFFWQYTNN